ncbi:MAG TPA: ABC transporter ATP-binding protein [Chthoniobacterales bacterium]
MSTPAASLENLTKIYPVHLRKERVLAVRNLNLHVEAGQVYGLLGPNGSGKSTSLKMLLGLVTPTSGTTRIFGKDSRNFDSKADVGFLPENPYFYKFLTAEETLRFYGKICGMGGRKLRERIDELLALVGMEDARHRRVGGYSKGMLQRIGLAQALMQSPRLLVLDEPTAGVDPVGSRQIRDLILDLKQRGITILLTSHLLEQVQQVCDRVGILSRGVLVREGKLEDLVSIRDQTEYVVQGASPQLAAQIERLVKENGAALVDVRNPEQTLEKVFIEATAERS